MIGFWDIVNSINDKNYIFSDTEEIEYNQRMINIAFSMYPDTVLLVNELNKLRRPLTNRQHYDFMYNATAKKKRFSKWNKKIPVEQDIKTLCNMYNISEHKMKDIMNVLSKQELDTLIKTTSKGGVNE